MATHEGMAAHTATVGLDPTGLGRAGRGPSTTPAASAPAGGRGDGLSVSVNVAGVPELMTKTLAQVRQEVAEAIRQLASTETNREVAGRLYEVAAMVNERLSAAEAREAVAKAPPTTHRHPSGAEFAARRAGIAPAKEEKSR